MTNIDTDSADSPTEPSVRDRFPIVGVGASAGGLAALEELLAGMPAHPGMAFVIVTHQHPGHASLMAEILGRKTSMPVVEVSSSTVVERDRVYIVRPGYDLGIVGGVLQPIEADTAMRPRLPIDFFFRSLAQDHQDLAIAIVLSGTGSDGSLGIRDIKAGLGMVIAQDERSAQYAGMPHSAIATEQVDHVLPVAEMPARLLAYANTRVVARDASAVEEPVNDAMQQIFVLIRDRTGHDFSQYKSSTIARRIARRMHVHQVVGIHAYVRYLTAHPTEIDLLFRELLIGVTSFFRDPEAWAPLARAVSELLAELPNDHVVRVWIPGCSTGEEAYSLAIVLREAIDALECKHSVQMFATDLDEAAIDSARAGVYGLGIARDVSAERLERFFIREDDSYKVRKELREMLVFAQQNVIADPPFTRVDLVSCRNLLIYLEPKLQRRLLPVFQYALRPEGLLFLGSSESLGAPADAFEVVDKKWKVFRRNEQVSAGLIHLPAASVGRTRDVGVPPGGAVSTPLVARLEHAVDRMLLQDLVPPTVVVHERGEIVHVHGLTGLFLEPAQGGPSTANIFKMAHDGLRIPLATGLRQAAKNSAEAVTRGVRVRTNGDAISVDLRIVRLNEPESLRGLFRVTFAEVKPAEADAEPDAPHLDPDRVRELERVLLYTKESHQGTIEELETANEELKSTNEELQSTNEELQSANEELETSKEEMQSLNEELQTVNAELQDKVEELSRANNDMKNLLNGTDIATVFLDRDLKIKRFTEQAKHVIHLIASDVGRPVRDLVSTLHYDHLVDDAREVLRTLVFREIEVDGEGGTAYLLRILPYRTTDNVIDGLVLTFVDVTRIKALQRDQARLIAALRGSPVSVFGTDEELRVTWASSAVFGAEPSELIGRRVRARLDPHDAAELAAIEQTVLQTAAAKRHRVELRVGAAPRQYDLYIEPQRDGDAVRGLSCVAVDLTEGP